MQQPAMKTETFCSSSDGFNYVPLNTGSSQRPWFSPTPGERMIVRVRSADTGGAYTVIESVAEPMCGPPLHVHEAEDEIFHILEGTLRFRSDGQDLDAPAGTSVTVPRGVAHTWWNFTDRPVRMLVVFTPGGIEGLVENMEGRTLPEIEHMAAKFNTMLVGPTLGGH